MSLKKTICLNMIVKDESHIIESTLDNISKYIDYWVICDTGSTDGTQDLIKNFFKKRDIPGNLIQHEWQNFGYNRTLALKECKGKADFLFIMDADDLIVGNLQFPVDMNADAYYLKFGTNFTWHRVQIFSNYLDWHYVGVLHEYAECLSKKNTDIRLIDGNYHIEGRCMGARSQDPKKYLKDAELSVGAIADALKENNSYMAARYTFYAAQSYTDYGDIENGIKYYRNRISMGGWIEEVYYSYYKIAKNLKLLHNDKIQQNDQKSILLVEQSFLDAYNYLPSRAEPLYELALMFRLSNNFEKGYHYACMGLKIEYPKDQRLFINKDIYDWRLKDERAISSYYLKKYQESFDLCQELLHFNNTIDNINRARIEKNSDFCVPYIKDNLTTYNPGLVNRISQHIKNINKNTEKQPLVTFSITTYNRFYIFERTINSFLNCCRDIFLIDKWICIDDNTNSDDRKKMERLYPFFEFIWKKSPEQNGHLSSMNIIIDKVTSPFLLHMADDCQFFEIKDYIKPSLEILQENSPDNSFGQVCFNRNYARTLSDRSIPGGFLKFTKENNYRYLIHEYYSPDSQEYKDFFIRHDTKLANCYWPHYSLCPSLLNTNIFKTVGKYIFNNNNNFELDFAYRYTACNYKTTFFDTISYLYIGNEQNIPILVESSNNTFKYSFFKFEKLSSNLIKIPIDTFINFNHNTIAFVCQKTTIQYFTEYIASLNLISFVITFDEITNLISFTDSYPKCFFIYPTDLGNDHIYECANRPNSCLFNSEQMSISYRRLPVVNFLQKNGRLINYNQTNANLLNKDYQTTNQMIYLPYICQKKEITFLHNLLVNTEKIFDYAIVGTLTPYRQVIADQLTARGLKVSIITNSFGFERDQRIAKCKVFLNIHANTNYQVFEGIRCNRWLAAGMMVISEKSLDDENIIHKNLFFIDNINLIEFCIKQMFIPLTYIKEEREGLSSRTIDNDNSDNRESYSLLTFNKWLNKEITFKE